MPSGSQATLRDIHLPDPVGWWPPAPGWWLLAGLVLLLGLGLWWLRRRARRKALPRAAAAELTRLQRCYEADGDLAALLAGVSAWLRRVALQYFPRAEIAALNGEAWLARLDQVLGEDGFRQGPGRVLDTGPYQRQAAADVEALLALCRRWLTALPAGGGRS
jgi:hypothetical protein